MNLPSNEYWGKRFGYTHPERGLIFKIKKWANGRMNSTTPGVSNRVRQPNRDPNKGPC